jgi:hypothetical protein
MGMNKWLIMKLYKIKVKLKKRLIFWLIPEGFFFRHKGYCPCCDKDVVFQSESSWLRDYFICNNCHSIPRERALMLVIEKYYPNWINLKIHESSPGNRGASEKLKNNADNYIASQYFPNKPFGTMVHNWLNQDLENQTFNNESFDIVITQDVMEHVYDAEKAFSEIARTLKKGGSHIFTVPIINKHKKSEVWATIDANGNPDFLDKPEWHGNVVDPNGSPVTMHWGFDIIDFIKDKVGLETTIEHIDDLNYGVRAELIEVLVSKKV